MDFKVNRETFATSEVALENCFEQAVELDYILPDYYPDIFRIMKCRIMPRIVSHSIIGDDISQSGGKKLTYELSVLIKIWYQAENSKGVSCIEQKMNFTKSAELAGSCENPMINICPRADYVNCRVVNQRRLDIRGAVSVKVRIVGEKKQSMIVDASGGNIQLKRSYVTYPAGRLIASKRITVVEELELGAAKPPILSVIRSDCIVNSTEQKIITGKLVTKGEANISMLYTCNKDDGEGIEAMKFSIPFSQIIDVEGIDEHYEAFIDITVTSCDIITKGVGETGEFECELVLLVNCTALRYETAELVTDAYSTCYECSYEVCETRLDNMPVPISESHSAKTSLVCQDGEISEVYDAWSDISNINARFDHDAGQFLLSGNVSSCAMVCKRDGFPAYLENDSVFEHAITYDGQSQDSFIEPKVSIVDCSYSLTSDNTVEVKTELSIGGYLYETMSRQLISDIKVDTEKKKQISDVCALKLYYAEEKEDIWEIAKKYSTSVEAIIEENDLTGEKLTEKGMLLIPIVT